jgi:hypothetical protein
VDVTQVWRAIIKTLAAKNEGFETSKVGSALRSRKTPGYSRHLVSDWPVAYNPTFIPKRYGGGPLRGRPFATVSRLHYFVVSRVGEQLLRERMTYVILNGIVDLFEKWSVHPDPDLYEARR